MGSGTGEHGRATGVTRRAFVNLATLRTTARSQTASLPDCTVDLRADAYGHGLIPVARALAEVGARRFLVSHANDASALTGSGVDGAIQVGAPGEGPFLGPELFGLDPAVATPTALRLVGEIIAVKHVGADRGVSYGYTYRTERPSTLVLVALGYADGILRVASNTAPVKVGETLGRITGRIAMDQFVVDIGDATAQPGDPVTLFGSADLGEPTVLDWADALGVTAPAITSRLGRRIERIHEGAAT